MNRYGLVALTAAAFAALTIGIDTAGSQEDESAASGLTIDALADTRAQQVLDSGRKIFRFDTFGDQAFWGDRLRLHQAIAGSRNGGVGPGLSPEQALALGLKVDVNALPPQLRTNILNRRVDLTSPATTLALLKLDAVVGVRGFFDDSGQQLRSVGITCALCHSDVDDSFAPGIGRRLDGWAARDLDVGRIIALAPNLRPLIDLLEIVHPGIDAADVRAVLRSWGPGKFDAELLLDGKATRPDGKPAATLIPPAFGLAGVNLHTWTGWGSVTHWNAFVANLEMGGQGTFFDPRLNDAEQFPIAAREGFGDLRSDPDLITSKLAALHFYQLAIPAPPPPEGSFDPDSAARGEELFNGRRGADVVTCRRSTPSRAGTCTRPRRSASTASRPTAPLSELTERRRSRVFGRTPRAVFTTTGDFAPCSRSSTTTIG